MYIIILFIYIYIHIYTNTYIYCIYIYMHNRNNRNALLIECFSPLYKLLRISPLQLTRTIVYCASQIIVFPTLSTVYIFAALFFPPLLSLSLSLLSRVTIFLFSLFKISPFQFPSTVTPRSTTRQPSAIPGLSGSTLSMPIPQHLLGKHNFLPQACL